MVSIAPILAVAELRDALVRGSAPVVGVSPVISGAPVRGMADKCLAALDVPCTAEGVGGLYGAAPPLDRLDGNGNLPFAVDFRAYYATLLERWWSIDSRKVLASRYAPLDFLA